jgi:hypothetical protein
MTQTLKELSVSGVCRSLITWRPSNGVDGLRALLRGSIAEPSVTRYPFDIDGIVFKVNAIADQEKLGFVSQRASVGHCAQVSGAGGEHAIAWGGFSGGQHGRDHSGRPSRAGFCGRGDGQQCDAAQQPMKLSGLAVSDWRSRGGAPRRRRDSADRVGVVADEHRVAPTPRGKDPIVFPDKRALSAVQMVVREEGEAVMCGAWGAWAVRRN